MIGSTLIACSITTNRLAARAGGAGSPSRCQRWFFGSRCRSAGPRGRRAATGRSASSALLAASEPEVPAGAASISCSPRGALAGFAISRKRPGSGRVAVLGDRSSQGGVEAASSRCFEDVVEADQQAAREEIAGPCSPRTSSTRSRARRRSPRGAAPMTWPRSLDTENRDRPALRHKRAAPSRRTGGRGGGKLKLASTTCARWRGDEPENL